VVCACTFQSALYQDSRYRVAVQWQAVRAEIVVEMDIAMGWKQQDCWKLMCWRAVDWQTPARLLQVLAAAGWLWCDDVQRTAHALP